MRDMKFHEKLDKLCSARGWSQAHIVRAMGNVSRSTVSNWFSGLRTPDLSAALQLAKLFEVPLEYLADDTLDEVPAPELSDQDRKILEMARALPAEEALRRLLLVPGNFQGVEATRPSAPGSRKKS